MIDFALCGDFKVRLGIKDFVHSSDLFKTELHSNGKFLRNSESGEKS